MSSIIDISQTLAKGIAVWPGDTSFTNFWVMQMNQGHSCNVGSVTMSLHTGTHADAPLHFLSSGKSASEASLGAYIGEALVVDLTSNGETVTVVTADDVAAIGEVKAERILFKTSSAQSEKWNPEFAYFDAGAANALVTRGIRLVGIDTPSVDKSDSTTLDSHKIFARADIAILENLSLRHVNGGSYELIALPLKFAGMDASPVRAILRTP